MPGTGTIHLPKRARDVRQIEAVGNQPAGRTFLFPTADDFRLDCRTNAMLGFRFQEGRRHKEYGAVAVFTDKCGSKRKLFEPNRRNRATKANVWTCGSTGHKETLLRPANCVSVYHQGQA